MALITVDRAIQFDPIVLRYEGLEADQHLLNLVQLGQSVQGTARLLVSAGTIVETGVFVKKSPAMSVRVMAGLPRSGCYEITEFVFSMTPLVMAIFPVIGDFGKTIATKAVTCIVNYAIAKIGGLACTRFRRHRVRCFDGTGGVSWSDGSLRESSSLRLCG